MTSSQRAASVARRCPAWRTSASCAARRRNGRRGNDQGAIHHELLASPVGVSRQRVDSSYNCASVQNPFAQIERDPAIVFALDRELRIIYCNAAWDRFAQLNGGRLLQRPQPYGLCILDVLPEYLRDLYDPAYRGVFTTGRQWVLQYECSSDVVYRLFRMTVMKRPQDDFILSVNFLVEERPHGQERQIANPDSMAYGAPAVVMCCFCRRTRRIDGLGWDWVPAYVQNPPTRVVQGICKDCEGKLVPYCRTVPPSPCCKQS